MKYEETYQKYIHAVDHALKEHLPPESQPPVDLHKAIHYAVFTGGKRFRPVLCLIACEACGGKMEGGLIPAASIELIHTYSLVHDDLPALDNDDLRRGNMTVHRRFGEAMAILTGDALLTLAFQLLAQFRPAERAVELASELSTSAGTYGMIGGQVADLQSASTELDLPTLDFINVHKTGKLIRASAVAGAVAAGAGGDERLAMQRYGEFMGLAFQSVDDLLDGDGYLRIMKPRALREQVRDLIAKAKHEVKPLGKQAEKLMKLADFLLERMPKETQNHVSMDS